MRIKRVVVPIAAFVIGVGSPSLAAAQAGERHHNRQSQNSEHARDDNSARQDNGNHSGRGGGSSDRGDQRAERRGSRDSQPQAQDRERAQADAQPQSPPPQSPQRARDDRANRDRGSRNGDSQRNSDSARGDSRYGRDDNRDSRGSRNSSAYDRGGNRGYSGRSYDRNDYRGNSNDRYRDNSIRGNYGYSRDYNGYSRDYNGYSRDYYTPRLLRRGYSQSHYYGPGGRLSLYFGLGSGYRYGSLYSGRVYGSRRGVASYGRYMSYGDIRLKDFPRDGAVYVDGGYAGIVDDFDGFFQRLTLEVGAHEIEVEVRGDESQFFDVYVDPYNTIDLHAEPWRR